VYNNDLEKAEAYYRIGGDKADRAIKEFIKECKLVVHGGKAINAYLPDWLERDTRDWDMFAKGDAEKYAVELEQKLDKRYGGDYFVVETAVHPGTYRIRNKITGDVVADITLQDKKVDFNNIRGINYATLEYHEDKIKETLANPEASYRRRKDTDTLQRIKIFKKNKPRRKPKRRGDNYPFMGSMRGI